MITCVVTYISRSSTICRIYCTTRLAHRALQEGTHGSGSIPPHDLWVRSGKHSPASGAGVPHGNSFTFAPDLRTLLYKIISYEKGRALTRYGMARATSRVTPKDSSEESPASPSAHDRHLQLEPHRTANRLNTLCRTASKRRLFRVRVNEKIEGACGIGTWNTQQNRRNHRPSCLVICTLTFGLDEPLNVPKHTLTSLSAISP